MNMMPSTPVVAHVSPLHASMIAHAQDRFSEFHNITVRANRLFWSLPIVDLLIEFRLRYRHFIMTGNLGWDGLRFQIQRAWVTITSELMLREDFEQRAITMGTLQHVFPLHQAHPPPAPPAPAQGPLSPLVLGTPQMSDSPGEAHVVMDLPDTSEIVVLSSDDELMEGFEDKDDLEEDQEVDEIAEEQQMDQEVDEAVGKQQVDHKVDEVELEISDSNFDSDKESKDESNPDYDLPRDC